MKAGSTGVTAYFYSFDDKYTEVNRLSNTFD